MDLQPLILEGRFVRLEPFSPALKDEVRAALDCDAEAWALVSSTSQGEAFDAGWDDALAHLEALTRISYAIRRLADRRVVGRSCYLDLRPADGGVEIGATFLH